MPPFVAGGDPGADTGPDRAVRPDDSRRHGGVFPAAAYCHCTSPCPGTQSFAQIARPAQVLVNTWMENAQNKRKTWNATSATLFGILIL